MNKIIGIVVSVAALGTFIGLGEVSAQRDEMPVGYPQSIEPELQVLLGRLRDEPSSPELLVKVASTYFDLADDLTDKVKRQAAYEEGAKAAKQAFQLGETNADAHFFHALNLGNAARLEGGFKLMENWITHCS